MTRSPPTHTATIQERPLFCRNRRAFGLLRGRLRRAGGGGTHWPPPRISPSPPAASISARRRFPRRLSPPLGREVGDLPVRLGILAGIRRQHPAEQGPK